MCKFFHLNGLFIINLNRLEVKCHQQFDKNHYTFLKNLCFIVLLELSQLSPLCPSPPIPHPAPTVNSHTVVHVRGSFIQVLCLALSLSFHHYLLSSYLPAAGSVFHVSMPVVLFCLLVYFVCWIPLIGEIIWYLFFTD